MSVQMATFSPVCNRCQGAYPYILDDSNREICSMCHKYDPICVKCFRVLRRSLSLIHLMDLSSIVRPSFINDRQIAYCKHCWLSEQPSKITDTLYLSSLQVANKYDYLKSLGIKQILAVGTELPIHESTDFSIKYVRIDDDPTVNIRIHFDDCHAFIESAPTLVHCYAGVSRSVTIVISYLMKKHDMSLSDAFSLCKERRPIINPNPGFCEQLMTYDIDLDVQKMFSGQQPIDDDFLFDDYEVINVTHATHET